MKDIMTYKEYIGSIHYSTEDEVFFGKLEGIDDLVTFEGSSVDELKKAFIEAVEDYVYTCKRNNKEPLKVYKGTFNVRVSPELHKKAAIKATEEGVSLNQIVEKALKAIV